MKFKVIGVLVILANFSIQSQGLPFGDFELASVAEYGEPSAELKRDKRTLTTICVEIKPSSPYEEPYFMCKGTDSPKYSKGSSDSSSSYSAKPTSSYKPSKPSSYSNGGESDSYHSSDNDYHAPSKPSEYHPEHSKYNSKPSLGGYDSAKEYSAPLKPSYNDKHPSYDSYHSDSYSHYEAPSKPSHSSYGSVKPSYADQHDSQDDYSNPHPVHKVTYEKPSAPATYSSKPQTYNHEIPSSYDHRQPSSAGGYSKPSSYEGHTSSGGGYSKLSSSYESSEYSKPSSYDHGSSHESKPSYNEDSHSKPSYGHDGHSYSAPPETKVLYSKPSSYPAKQTAYEHASDNSQYSQQKPAYSEQPSSSHYSKPSQDYGKPASYTPSERHSAAYAPPPQSHSYRMMPQELMQPTWESQPQQLQSDGFGYRSYGAPMEYQQRQETPRMMNPESQLYTGLEGPLRFDLSGSDQEAPTLQSPYLHQTYSAPAPVAPSYGPHYAPAAPSYPGPAAYPPAAPSYASVPPSSYVPVAVPSYAPPAAPSYAPAPSSTVYPAPPCPQNYMYSYQPVIMSVPCYSLSAGYSLPSYGQSLGAPAKVNPLQDHTGARSESGGNSDSSHKSAEDDSQESQENSDKKTDSEVETSQTPSTLKKSDNLRKPSSGDNTSEEKKQVDKNTSQEQTVGGPAAAPVVEKPIQETQIAALGANPKNPNEAPHTKEAFNAMMKMARIAAQLNKDDPSNKGATDAGVGSTMQANEKPTTGTNLQQFSTRTN